MRIAVRCVGKTATTSYCANNLNDFKIIPNNLQQVGNEEN